MERTIADYKREKSFSFRIVCLLITLYHSQKQLVAFPQVESVQFDLSKRKLK